MDRTRPLPFSGIAKPIDMPPPRNLISFLAICCTLFLFVFANFSGQVTPTLSPAPSESPTPQQSPSTVAVPTPSPLPGWQNFHRWGSITLFNGLPSDSVRAIAQTADGVLWFGTDNGLARFDGRRIQNFTFGDEDDNRVLALKAARNGELWIGTQKGAFVYAENRVQTVAGTENLAVTTIVSGTETYLGTNIGTVFQVSTDPNGGHAIEKLFPEPLAGPDGKPLNITSLVDDDVRVLIGTSGGGVFQVHAGRTSEFSTSTRPLFVNSLVRDSAGDVWMGTDAKKGISGIYLVKNGSRAERITAPTADVLKLEAGGDGVWAATSRYGLFHHLKSGKTDSYTFDNTSGGLRSDTVYSIFTDREGVVWIGTNRGVSRYDPEGPNQETVSDIPNSNFIRTIWQSGDGRAMFAGSNRGLFEFDGEQWKRVSSLKEKAVYTIDQNSNGIIVGTPSGIFDSNGKLLVDGDTRCIDYFQAKTYAGIYGRGVVEVTDNTQKVVFAESMVTSLFGRFADRLWIGTAGNGLFSFDGHSVKTEASPNVLKSGTIWKILQADDNNIWIAGEHGVFRLQNGQVEQIIAADDVRDVWVYGGDVWAATTTRGLLHARHDDHLGWLISPIGFEQGLPSEKAFSIIPSGGGLLIATNRGVVTYYPHKIAPKLIPVRVLSQRMHELSELNAPISLDYPQNSLLVEVAGLSSRTFPEEFQYSFTLKNGRGEVTDSKFAKDPQYAPGDLKPGDYVIEAIAYDRDLNASEPLLVRFSVGKAPFPWTATALSILLAIAVIALIWAIIERRRIALRNRELAAARFDLANEAERERSRIARDLHDQTLADLRNLLMMSDRLSPPNAEFRSEIESVSTEIRRICEDLSPSVLENVGLTAALEFLLSHTIENRRFHVPDDL
ncbi:MAG: two-component regulator propeller domain-containing protein, partial [Acidobacteriota bacterium]